MAPLVRTKWFIGTPGVKMDLEKEKKLAEKYVSMRKNGYKQRI
jgi:hypothetical protein